LRPGGPIRYVVLVLACSAAIVQGATLTIVSWNIYSYNDPESENYAALVRIVQALNPDLLLLAEANNTTGRNTFFAQFAARYPYQFLGAPTSDNPRNQILSAYPLSNPRQIFTPDPNGGNFQRPTITADVDVLPLEPGPELRVYAAHFKSGTVARDDTLRLNQALDDADDIAALISTNPTARIIYAGDLNCLVGDAPLSKLLEPRTSLNRLSIVNPNNNSPTTRWPSGRVIDHVLYSSSLDGAILNPFIFYSATYLTGAVPPPALAGDSETTSDHLALVYQIELGDITPPEPIRLNEVYASHAGVDDHEFIELVGPPGAALSGLAVMIIEGDSESPLGTIDQLWKLDGYTIPANGLFVLGDSAVATQDLGIGASNMIENGTETILLVRNASVTSGQDVDADDNGTADMVVGTIVDRLALVDDGINGSDRTYYDAPRVGPIVQDAPPGVARVPDSTGGWVTLSFEADGSDGQKAPTPGLSNLPGDFDRDGDVDSADLVTFNLAHAGPGTPTGNARTDLDDDGDTDQEDFGLFQVQITE
jgi:endonuclease/exonuclease/phosphatase family metal-dependent hydrolase